MSPSILHSILGTDGAVAVFITVLATAVLMLHIAALVVLSESRSDPRSRWRWVALVVLVPVVGPIAYLVHAREDLRPPPRA